MEYRFEWNDEDCAIDDYGHCADLFFFYRSRGCKSTRQVLVTCVIFS